MRYAEIISESVERLLVNNAMVAIHRNPTSSQLFRLIDELETIRGLVYDNTVWIWNGYEAVHFQIKAVLGLPKENCGELVLQKVAAEPGAWEQYYRLTCIEHQDLILSSSNFQRAVSKLKPLIV